MQSSNFGLYTNSELKMANYRIINGLGGVICLLIWMVAVMNTMNIQQIDIRLVKSLMTKSGVDIN